MAFKLRSGNTTSFKKMGSKPMTNTSPAKKTYEEAYADRDQKIYGELSQEEYTTEAKRQMANYKKTGKWDAPKESMKSSARVAAAAAGDGSKTNKVTGRTKTTTSDTDPNTGADRTTKTTTRKDGTTARIKSETDDKKSVSRINRDGDKQTNVVKTGRSTDTKADDVKTKTKIRGGDEPTQTTRTRTADTVTKTETDLKTGDTTSKSRKRLGKGLIKDVVAKGKARRDARKANKPGKVKGSKAPEGTTYDPADDTSNMPSSMKKYKKK